MPFVHGSPVAQQVALVLDLQQKLPDPQHKVPHAIPLFGHVPPEHALQLPGPHAFPSAETQLTLDPLQCAAHGGLPPQEPPPLGTGLQMPPPLALQTPQPPLQALLQQTPDTQKPELHALGSVPQLAPLACLAWQTPLAPGFKQKFVVHCESAVQLDAQALPLHSKGAHDIVPAVGQIPPAAQVAANVSVLLGTSQLAPTQPVTPLWMSAQAAPEPLHAS